MDKELHFICDDALLMETPRRARHAGLPDKMLPTERKGRMYNPPLVLTVDGDGYLLRIEVSKDEDKWAGQSLTP